MRTDADCRTAARRAPAGRRPRRPHRFSACFQGVEAAQRRSGVDPSEVTSRIASCAAASRATGTRNGEQDT